MMMKRHIESAVFALVGIAAVAACGSSPTGGPLPGRVSEGSAALVGTWEGRDPNTGRLKTRVTLESSGGFTSVEYNSSGAPGQTTTGKFSVSGNILSAEGRATNDTPFRAKGPFFVDDRSFVVNAFYPVDGRAGIVGTWVSWNEVGQVDANGAFTNGGRTTTTLVFGADGTVVVTKATQPFSPTARPTNLAYDATNDQSPAGTYNISPRGSVPGAAGQRLISLGDAVLADKVLTRASN
jgi:hypothetical protein